MWRILLEVMRSRGIAWKPSKQANMLISFGLPRPGSACFVFRGRIRSYTKGIYLDFGSDRCRLFSQQCTVWVSACLAVRACGFCERVCGILRGPTHQLAVCACLFVICADLLYHSPTFDLLYLLSFWLQFLSLLLICAYCIATFEICQCQLW